ncbi:MAG: arsenate reductase family protein [Rikenellaceae bacterium]
MKPTLLIYPKCSTCQTALKWFTENNVDVEIRHIVEQNPSAAELKKWIAESGLPIRRFFNTSGIKYREMNIKDRFETATDAELIDLLASDGMLVKRPLLISAKAIIPGRREAEYATALL